MRRIRRTLSPYHGRVFRWQQWSESSHPVDTCLRCGAPFGHAQPGNPHAPQTHGWQTLAHPMSGMRQYEWLCPNCFEEVREELGLIVDPDHPQWEQTGP